MGRQVLEVPSGRGDRYFARSLVGFEVASGSMVGHRSLPSLPSSSMSHRKADRNCATDKSLRTGAIGIGTVILGTWHHPSVVSGRFQTPQEAALSGWEPSAAARVVSCTTEGTTAWVIVDTEPSHPMEVVCAQGQDGLWDWVSDSAH